MFAVIIAILLTGVVRAVWPQKDAVDTLMQFLFVIMASAIWPLTIAAVFIWFTSTFITSALTKARG